MTLEEKATVIFDALETIQPIIRYLGIRKLDTNEALFSYLLVPELQSTRFLRLYSAYLEGMSAVQFGFLFSEKGGLWYYQEHTLRKRVDEFEEVASSTALANIFRRDDITPHLPHLLFRSVGGAVDTALRGFRTRLEETQKVDTWLNGMYRRWHDLEYLERLTQTDPVST